MYWMTSRLSWSRNWHHSDPASVKASSKAHNWWIVFRSSTTIDTINLRDKKGSRSSQAVLFKNSELAAKYLFCVHKLINLQCMYLVYWPCIEKFSFIYWTYISHLLNYCITFYIVFIISGFVYENHVLHHDIFYLKFK